MTVKIWGTQNKLILLFLKARNYSSQAREHVTSQKAASSTPKSVFSSVTMAAKGETGTYSLKVSHLMLKRPVEAIWDLGAATVIMLRSSASRWHLLVSDLLSFLTRTQSCHSSLCASVLASSS